MPVTITCRHCERPIEYHSDIPEWWHEGGTWECSPIQEVPKEQLPLFDAPVRSMPSTSAAPGYLLVDGPKGITIYSVTQDDTTPSSWVPILK